MDSHLIFSKHQEPLLCFRGVESMQSGGMWNSPQGTALVCYRKALNHSALQRSLWISMGQTANR